MFIAMLIIGAALIAFLAGMIVAYVLIKGGWLTHPDYGDHVRERYFAGKGVKPEFLEPG